MKKNKVGYRKVGGEFQLSQENPVKKVIFEQRYECLEGMKP